MYKKVSFSFMIPTLIFLGCLYASVTGRFVFFRLFRNSRHLNDHTVVGWASWAGILLVTWIAAFLISQVIPFFSSRKYKVKDSVKRFERRVANVPLHSLVRHVVTV